MNPKIDDARLSLFLMLGKEASKQVALHPETVQPTASLLISPTSDLATIFPDDSKRAASAASAYKLFFIFEHYLRSLIIETLGSDETGGWWDKAPKDVKEYIEQRLATEEEKAWMSLGARPKISLTTISQLLRIIEECWKEHFEDVIRDRALIQEAKAIVHLRNAIGHMTEIPDEEIDRVKLVMRDWFRMVAP